MPADIRTSKIEMEKEFGVVLKSVVHDARRAATAVDAYGRAIRRLDEAHVRANGSRRRALLSTRQLTHENRVLSKTLASLQRAALRPAGADAALTGLLVPTRGDRQQTPPRTRARVERTRRPAPDPRVSEQRIDFDTLDLINSWIGALGSGAEDIARTPASRLSPIGKAVRNIPRIGTIGKALSLTAAVTGPVIVAGKHLQNGIPTEEPALVSALNGLGDFLSVAGSAATLASAAAPFLGPTLGGAALTLGAAAIPLTVTGLVLGIGLSVGKRIYDKRQARQRELDARLMERRRNLPQETRTELEKEARDSERRLAETYNTLRLSNQSIVNLTGQNVDDLLKNLQGLNPRALEAYFQSLREGRGKIEQLSQAQLAHIDLIEQLVVTYRALAVESDAARDAAAEYADHLRPVDVIFETLVVHAGALTSQFVEQREALQRHTQATEAQAQAARDVAAATTAQVVATERANTGEVARTQHLLRTTQHTRKATEQVSDATERLTELTGALVTTDAGLATHSEHVGYVTEAYRELSAQIDDTIGDVLAGAVSFKEAWESLGRGVLDTVKHLGRQLLDSLLGSVRDVGRRLADVIFGQVQGTLGSFGLGASRGFLPSVSGASLGGFPVGLPTFPGGGGFTGLGFPGTAGGGLLSPAGSSLTSMLASSPVGSLLGLPGLRAGGTATFNSLFGTASGANPYAATWVGQLGGFLSTAGPLAGLGAGLFGAGHPLARGISGGLGAAALIPGPQQPFVAGAALIASLFGGADLFGWNKPTRIDTEKRGLRDFFREVAPGFDYQRKERRVASGLGSARAAGLDVENAYLVAGLPYALGAKNAGLGTVTRFRNIGVGGLGRSGASRDTARKTALKVAGQAGVDTTEGAVEYLLRAIGGGFARDPFTVAEVLENRDENAGETRHSRNRIVRLRDVVAGIIDIQTEFAGFVDSGRLAARILADETEQALRTAGRDAGEYADVLGRIRDGSTHAAEALQEIGGLDFADLTFSAAEFDAHLLRIKDDVEGITAAARTALTTGFAEGHTRAQVEQNFEDTVDDAIKNAFITRTIDAALDLDSLFEGIDLTDPAAVGGETLTTIRERVGAGYQNALDILQAAGISPGGTLPDAQDPDALAAAAAVRRGSRERRLEAVGALAPGTANVNLLNTEIGTLRRDVGALALPSPDSSTEELQTAVGLIDQLADKTVAYYQTAIAEQQRLSAAYTTVADSLDQRLQGLIGAPGGLTKTEQLATLQARAQGIREDLTGLTGTDRAAALDRLGANLEAQVRLGAYSQGDPRQRALFTRNTTEMEDLRMDADHHAKTVEQAIEDLQGAVVTELEQLHTLSDTYYQTAIGKFEEINESIRAYQPPTDLPEIEPPPAPKRNREPEPQESAAARAASATGAPRITINVTLPEGGDAEDTAAYARAFVAELERQLQPGARGYELVHTITRESGAR